MFSFDVHKLKFKVSIRSDVFELRYDEISFVYNDSMVVVVGGGVVLFEFSDRLSLSLSRSI